MAAMRRGFAWLLVVLGGALAVTVWLSWPRQEADADFDARVKYATYVSWHPHVLFDEGHYNVHTAAGTYRPLADLLRNDGYVVESTRQSIQPDVLAGHDVLVVANALGLGGAMQAVANNLRLERVIDLTGSAFSNAECEWIADWVRSGGSLLLVADHAPAGEAATELAARFGVGMSNWFAEDERHHDPETDNPAFLVFSRENGLLIDHAITRGRTPDERIDKVITFTGQALRPPQGAAAFLELATSAREYPYRRSSEAEGRSAAGLAQGIALEAGRGRVVVLGEAAAITSQIVRDSHNALYLGMGRPGCDDRQLALNIMHWLTHALD
jgi:hypothetical protein